MLSQQSPSHQCYHLAATAISMRVGHRIGSPAKHATPPSEKAAVALLAGHPAAHFTVQDAVSAILVTPLSPMSSSCALVNKGIVQGDGCHMQAANLPSEQAAVDLLAVHFAGNLPAYSLHRCSNAIRSRVGYKRRDA